MKKTRQTILYVKLNSFLSSVETSLNPLLRNKPVLVTKDGKVISSNKCGLSKQILIDQAKKMIPEAVTVEAYLPNYENFSKEFYKILSEFSDAIEPVTLDEAYVDVTGFDKKWISPESMANEIRKRIYEELEITSSIGIAGNKICAMSAAKSTLPNSVFYVAWGQEKFFLHNKPLTYLPTIGPRTARYLMGLGINNIGDLAKQSLDWLMESFGENGTMLWHLANGLDRRKINAPYYKKSYSKSITFSFPTNDYNYLSNEIYNLVTHLWKKMKNNSKISNTVGIRLIDHLGNIKTKQEKFFQNLNSQSEIHQAAKKLLALLMNHNTKVNTLTLFVFNIQNVSSQNKSFENSFHKIKEIRHSIKKLAQEFGMHDQQNLAAT